MIDIDVGLGRGHPSGREIVVLKPDIPLLRIFRFKIPVAGLSVIKVVESRSPEYTFIPRTGAQPAPARRGLRFNENGRWGLNLNFSQPVGRESELGDVEAGAYYRLSPRLRVGAAAGLSAPETDPARAPETDRRTQPRLRLESIFKF